MKLFGDKSDEKPTLTNIRNKISNIVPQNQSDKSSIPDNIIQTVSEDILDERYTAAIQKIEQYNILDENKEKLNELYYQCIQKNTEIFKQCIQLYEEIPSKDILSKLSLLHNAAEHLSNMNDLETIEKIFSDIQAATFHPNEKAEQSLPENGIFSIGIVQSIGHIFDNTTTENDTIVPPKAEVSKLSESMVLLTTEKDYTKKLELSNSIIKYFPAYLTEQIRSSIHLFKLNAFQKELSETSDDDLVKRISLCKSLIELTGDENYKKQLDSYEAEFKTKNDEQTALLMSNYANNKTEIYNSIARYLFQKDYTLAAQTIDKYYPVAQNDNAFADILNVAKQAALSIRTATLQAQLTTLNADDYINQKAIYHQLLKLNPLDPYYLSELNSIESILNNSSNNDVIDIEPCKPETSRHDPLVVEQLPASVQVSNTSLQRITNPETVGKLSTFLSTAAKICHKGSILSKQIGDFMHKYSNSPLIQLASNVAPGGAAVSPVMEGISAGSKLLAQVFAKGEQLLGSSTTEYTNDSEAIKGTFLAIIKPKEQFAALSQNDSDVSDEFLNDLVEMTSTLASYVVGGYYMSQISTRLDDIQNAISKVSDFQDSEYQSKVMALCAQISKMSQFRAEIINNDELCRRELTKLADYEHECIELIGQANIALSKQSSSQLTNYEAYEANLKEMSKWYQYQDSLLRVLSEISRFTFTLNKGTVSIENCSTLFHLYEKQVVNVRTKIKAYHQSAATQLEIDLVEKKRKVQTERSSGLFAKLSNIIDSNTSQPIADEIINMIDVQMNSKAQMTQSNENLYKKDLRIIFKDNSFYYLTDEDSETDEDLDINWALSVLRKGE